MLDQFRLNLCELVVKLAEGCAKLMVQNHAQHDELGQQRVFMFLNASAPRHVFSEQFSIQHD